MLFLQENNRQVEILLLEIFGPPSDQRRLNQSEFFRLNLLRFFSISKDEDSTSSLGNLFQSLTTTMVKNIIPNFYFSLCSLPLVLLILGSGATLNLYIYWWNIWKCPLLQSHQRNSTSAYKRSLKTSFTVNNQFVKANSNSHHTPTQALPTITPASAFFPKNISHNTSILSEVPETRKGLSYKRGRGWMMK